MTDDELKERVAAAKAKYDALSPVDKAIHDLRQKRSGMIGLSNFDRPVEEITARIDAMPEFVLLSEIDRLRAQNKSLVITGATFTDQLRKVRNEALAEALQAMHPYGQAEDCRNAVRALITETKE